LIIIENDDDDGYTYIASQSKTDVVATMMMMMMATRVKAGLIVRDRKRQRREGRTVSLLRTHTGKEQNRTLLTFEQ
jgi:hypothetical protein